MKNIFKKEEKNISKPVIEENDKKSNYFYGIIFIIILILAIISRFFWNDDDKNENVQEYSSSQKVKKDDSLLKILESNNYDMSLSLINDTDLIYYLIRKESPQKELIYKKYRDEEHTYYKDNEKFYEFANNNLKEINNVNLYNSFDQTFININNIEELINSKTYEIDLLEENYKIKRYKIESSKVLDIYNAFNKTDIEKKVSGEVILDINYEDNILLGIELDLTNLYKNLEIETDNVLYSFKFDNFNEIKIEDFLDNKS